MQAYTYIEKGKFALGIMKRDANIQMPNGTYSLGIWLVFRLWKKRNEYLTISIVE